MQAVQRAGAHVERLRGCDGAPATASFRNTGRNLLHITPSYRPTETTMSDPVQKVTETRTDYCLDVNDLLVFFNLTGAVWVNDEPAAEA